MRVAYLECFSGIAGDMLMAALVHAGVPLAVLQEATSALGLDASLRTEAVTRCGIAATKLHVLEHGRVAEGDDVDWLPRLTYVGSTVAPAVASTAVLPVASAAPQGARGMPFAKARRTIESAAIGNMVKAMALQALDRLTGAEARMHHASPEDICFHECGAVDVITDIVANCAGIHYLGIDRWFCSPVNVGGGFVQCTQGTFPVPTPAVAELLLDCPTYSAHTQKELVTPTGAALLRTLQPLFGPQPAMVVGSIGYGAGTRNPPLFPNLLRLSVGESVDVPTHPAPAVPAAASTPAVSQVTRGQS